MIFLNVQCLYITRLIQFIDSKSCIKKRRGLKTALSSYYACLSRDLLLMASGADTHIHIKQRSQTKRFQETRRRGLCPREPGLIIVVAMELK